MLWDANLALSRTLKVAIIIAIIVVAGIVAYIFIPKSARADVKVWIQVVPSEEQIIRDYVTSSFRALYPNITVEITNVADLKTRLLAALPAGKGPDLFMFAHDWTGTFAEPGFLENLDDLVTPELRDKFVDSAWQACIYNNSVYALPYGAETVALIYNKQLVSVVPENMSQLESQILYFWNTLGMYGIASFVDPYYVSAWPYGFGGYYFNDTTKMPGLNATDTVRGVRFFLDNFQPYMSQENSRDAQVALFTGNRTPFLIDGPWGIGYLKQLNMSFGVTVLPYISEIGAWPKPYTGIKVIWMTKTVYDRAKAFTFMKWFSTNTTFITQRALQFGFIPVLKEVLALPEIQSDEIVSAFARQVSLGIPMPKSIEMTYVWGPLTTALNTLFIVGSNDPTKTPEAVLTQAQAQVLESLKTAGA